MSMSYNLPSYIDPQYNQLADKKVVWGSGVFPRSGLELKEDGTVVFNDDAWKDNLSDCIPENCKSDVKAIIGNGGIFAVLKTDGSVFNNTWKDDPDSFSDTDKVRLASGGVKSMASTEDSAAFAFVKEDGSVVSMGRNLKSYRELLPQLTDVESVIGNRYAFAALKADGTVVVFGHPAGGTQSDVDGCEPPLVGVKALYCAHNGCGFVALKDDGSAVCIGNDRDLAQDPVAKELAIANDVQAIFMNCGAVCAVKTDGSRVVFDGGQGYKGATGCDESKLWTELAEELADGK